MGASAMAIFSFLVAALMATPRPCEARDKSSTRAQKMKKAPAEGLSPTIQYRMQPAVQQTGT